MRVSIDFLSLGCWCQIETNDFRVNWFVSLKFKPNDKGGPGVGGKLVAAETNTELVQALSARAQQTEQLVILLSISENQFTVTTGNVMIIISCEIDQFL